MAQFAEDITTFLECLNEFPEFTDEAVNASILAFQGDLKVGLGPHLFIRQTLPRPVSLMLLSCSTGHRALVNIRVRRPARGRKIHPDRHSGQFKYPAVQRYLHDLSTDLGEHIESITSALSLFIEVGKLSHFAPVQSFSLPYHDALGVPTIRFAQKHGAQNLLNLSTVATFFSSVTATSLQFSFSATNSTAANAVNAFWFTSLVFSIGGFIPVYRKCLPLMMSPSRCSQQPAGVDLEAGHVVRRFVVCLSASP